MNGQAILKLLSDRPIAYHPDVARIVGGVKPAVFLCQLLYWTGKGKRDDGFIWKTRADMEEETALTRSEQESARKKLNALGILEEKLSGIPARLHYRVDTDRLLELMSAFYDKQVCGKPANCDAENLQTNPENTSENTTEHVADDARVSVGGDLATQEWIEELENQTPPPRNPPRSAEEMREQLLETEQRMLARQAQEPCLTWGMESEEIQRQVQRFGNDAYPVLRLGYELDKALGLRPVWCDRKKVKTWTSGLSACLAEADGDWQMVVEAAREMRENKLSIKNPYSIEGMVADAAAKKRGSQQPSHIEVKA